MKRLGKDFFLRENVVDISKELIGKFLVTNIQNKLTSGMIVETEAYNGVIDKASHAYNGRRTQRNEIMYGEGGNTYVYLCYGIHHLFNIVTNKKEIPHAVLIRAVVPKEGIETVLKRRNQKSITKKISDGPGTASQALGIKIKYSGISLNEKLIWVEDRGVKFTAKEIKAGPRIGVDYAGKDALLPYRFRLNDNIITNITNEWHS
ncbi:MAG TPA: DNA-3-methyladenine glycosylase [Bacteroidia bacterium]|jgi:DNA-3-methyladenine glycosylase|nr:DNA-3-methyladenine glycosylase [Bacteroidia bacterium]